MLHVLICIAYGLQKEMMEAKVLGLLRERQLINVSDTPITHVKAGSFYSFFLFLVYYTGVYLQMSNSPTIRKKTPTMSKF